jgi:hypothetical protein
MIFFFISVWADKLNSDVVRKSSTPTPEENDQNSANQSECNTSIKPIQVYQ